MKLILGLFLNLLIVTGGLQAQLSRDIDDEAYKSQREQMASDATLLVGRVVSEALDTAKKELGLDSDLPETIFAWQITKNSDDYTVKVVTEGDLRIRYSCIVLDEVDDQAKPVVECKLLAKVQGKVSYTNIPELDLEFRQKGQDAAVLRIYKKLAGKGQRVNLPSGGKKLLTLENSEVSEVKVWTNQRPATADSPAHSHAHLPNIWVRITLRTGEDAIPFYLQCHTHTGDMKTHGKRKGEAEPFEAFKE